MDKDSLYAPYPKDVVCVHKTSYGGVEYPYHRHDGYEIFLFLRGEAFLYIEDKRFDVLPGDLYIMGPTNRHRLQTKNKDAYERVTINIRDNALRTLSSLKTDLTKCFSKCSKGVVLPVTVDKDVRNRYVILADIYNKYVGVDGYGYDIRRINYMTELLLMVNEAFMNYKSVRKNIMPKLVSEMILYIEANVTEGIGVTDVAEHFSYDRAYLSRLFKEHTGIMIKEYIGTLRLEKSKDILLENGSVSDACYKAGFNDYANFIRKFKANTGLSPGKWKASNLFEDSN